VLVDEVFLPYDGGAPIQPAQLKIPRHALGAGPYWVNLENGRILIPKSRFDEIKREFDRTSLNNDDASKR
jgi:hypothetical protein